MKKYFLLLISFICVQFSQAQQNYEPAYIITLQGDSISGFIDYRNWNSNPESFKFKTSLNAEEVTYTTKEISRCSVHEEIYINAKVDVEFSYRATHLLKYDSELQIEKRQVFLLSVFQGEKSLLYYKDDLGYENFYIPTDQDYSLLIYKRYLKVVEKKDVIAENSKFKGQLTYYLGNCSKIQSSINKAQYTRESLERVFNKYYAECTDFQITHAQKKEKDVINYGAIIGVSSTEVKFDGPNAHLTRSPFPKSTNITAGGFIEVTFSRSRERISINNELTFTTFKTENNYEDRYKKEYVEIGSTHLHVNNMFRYKIPIGDFQIFANIGLANSFLFGETNYFQLENKFNNTIKEDKALSETRTWEVGYLMGAGVLWKHFSLEYRYHNSSGMSVFLDLSSWTKRNIIYLGYRF